MLEPAWVRILSELEEFENNDFVLDWRVDDLEVWPIIKSKLISSALQDAVRDRRIPLGFVERWTERIQARINRKPRLSPAKIAKQFLSDPNTTRDLWCLGNAVPTTLTSQGYAHGHFDAYRILAESRGLDHWGVFYRESSDDPRLTGAIVQPNSGFGELFAALRPSTEAMTDENWTSRLNRVMKNEVIRLQITDNLRVLRSLVAAALATRDMFRAIFDVRRPKLVLCFNYYQPIGWGLCAAAKERGVTVLDVQHGAQGRHHHAYHWQRFPEKGWNCVPDGFILYGVPAGSLVTGYTCHKSMPSWYLWSRFAYGLESSVRRDNRWIQLGNQLLAESRSFWGEADTRTQPWYLATPFAGENDMYSKALAKLMTGKGRILSRRHPAGKHERTKFETLPISAALAAVDGLVTGYSASILEAAGMSLTSFVNNDNAFLFYEGVPMVRLDADPSAAASQLLAQTRLAMSAEERLVQSVTTAPLPLSWLPGA